MEKGKIIGWKSGNWTQEGSLKAAATLKEQVKSNRRGQGKVHQVVAGHWKLEACDWQDDMIFFLPWYSATAHMDAQKRLFRYFQGWELRI